MAVDIRIGDCREVLADIGAQFDSCVTDPPYHLTSIVKRFGKEGSAPVKVSEFYKANGESKGSSPYARSSAGFMGKQWDGGGVAFEPETWRAVYDVLKPGAHLVAFGGTRTYHRMVCAIEDAGFEIRDQLAWVYGSGFPKSHNLDGDWQGWGTALKPAWEPIVLARKPLVGTVAQNVLQHGTGALNIDGCRVETGDKLGGGGNTTPVSDGWDRPYRHDPAAIEKWKIRTARKIAHAENAGRWPANIVHDGSEEVVGAFPDAPGQMADISPDAPSPKTGNVYGKMNRHGEKSALYRYTDKGSTDFAALPGQRRNDTGSAARFFYCAKADKEDRAGSKHPTVKPLALMRWLVRLVTPPGGLVLDPFAGTGTTGQAALEEGMRAVLIERETEYVADIERRMAQPIQIGGLV